MGGILKITKNQGRLFKRGYMINDSEAENEKQIT